MTILNMTDSKSEVPWKPPDILSPHTHRIWGTQYIISGCYWESKHANLLLQPNLKKPLMPQISSSQVLI